MQFANDGASPSDLSLVVSFVRVRGAEDYIFHLLTNYMAPPAGIAVDTDQHYNPYILGGAIGMPQVIYNGVS